MNLLIDIWLDGFPEFLANSFKIERLRFLGFLCELLRSDLFDFCFPDLSEFFGLFLGLMYIVGFQ